MAAETRGATAPRSRHALIHDPVAGSTVPLTIEVSDVRPHPYDVGGPMMIDRAEIDVTWDGDCIRIEVRRLEDDPQVEVVLR